MSTMSPHGLYWYPDAEDTLRLLPDAIDAACHDVRAPLVVARHPDTGHVGVGVQGQLVMEPGGYEVLGLLPALYPEWLGDRAFQEVHGVRFPYVVGAMANGIASARLVIAMARAGMLAFFGAAGLPLHAIQQNLDVIQAELAGCATPWGANLIHAPHEPALEASTAEEFIRRGVTHISASAYMNLTPAIVHVACAGLREDEHGNVVRKHHIFAKISRPEVARHFMRPAPDAILEKLVAAGKITEYEAALAKRVPVAEDITVESDSGGHTDNQPLTALFSTIVDERAAAMSAHQYARPIRLGAAGGLGTPQAVAAAFALGAAFVLTGSVNQAAIESGLSEAGRLTLAKVDLGDVMMAPAADMFEIGAKLQVVRGQGTMFGVRAQKLYEIYRAYNSIDEIPAAERAKLERQVFRSPLEEIWSGTRAFFSERDPTQLRRADSDPKHKMALIFRWYLGLSSRWAIDGNTDRTIDYQIWCGPAQAAFNRWSKGSFLEDPAQREAVQIALNLLEGAAVLTRAHQLRTWGVPVPDVDFRPRRLA